MKKKQKKVKVAIFDRDLRVETKKYKISSSGSKISIRRGGKRNFNPSFTETSYLEMPKGFGRRERVYFVRSNSSKCVDFATGEVSGPDPVQVSEAVEADLIKNFGKEDKTVPWYNYVTMGLLFLIILILIQ